MRVSAFALVLVVVASCYGNPRIGARWISWGRTPAAESPLGDGRRRWRRRPGGTAGGGVSDGGLRQPHRRLATPLRLPAAPKLLRPMRGAYTGSLHAPSAIATLRPTFSWAAVAPTCGAVTYEVQGGRLVQPRRPRCVRVPKPRARRDGRPDAELHANSRLKVRTTPPVGAFYAWRVRACDASTRCGAWSEVRYLHVGRVREDINGDGYGDLLALSNRGIEVYLGSSQFNMSAPSSRSRNESAFHRRSPATSTATATATSLGPQTTRPAAAKPQ